MIVTADAFDVAHEVNDAVEGAHWEGVRTAASRMGGAPEAVAAVARARRLPSLTPRSRWRRSRPTHSGARSSCSLRTEQSYGALPSPAPTGGAKYRALACPYGRCARVRGRREESCKRQAWGRSRSWSRVTSGRVVQRAGCWLRWDLELADPALARPSLPREHLEVWGHRITAALLLLGTEVCERQSPAMGWVFVGLISVLLGVVVLFVCSLRWC